MKKLILFGSGAYGLKALNYFGEENVYAFCDNGCKAHGEKYGVLYIPFEELLQIHHKYIVFVSTNVNNSHEIANQLLDNGIDDFVVFNENIIEEIEKYSPKEYVKILNNDSERFKRERNQFIVYKNNIAN